MKSLDCLNMIEISKEDALAINAGHPVLLGLAAIGAISSIYSAAYYIGYAAGATVAFVENLTDKK